MATKDELQIPLIS